MPQAALDELRAGMFELPVWLVISRTTGVDPRPLLEEHLAYLRRLQLDGVLFASGPIGPTFDESPFGGATAIRAASASEAHRIMAEEPYVRAGARSYELIAWTVRQGDLERR